MEQIHPLNKTLKNPLNKRRRNNTKRTMSHIYIYIYIYLYIDGFDNKLTWSVHIANAINKARKSMFGLRLLKFFFNQSDMRTLVDSYFYSVLYYNSCIWLTPNLSSDLKQNLLSISANALRSCVSFQSNDISFENIHKINKKSTPKQLMKYKIAISLHKIINDSSEVPHI